jgi:hypothetical protein
MKRNYLLIIIGIFLLIISTVLVCIYRINFNGYFSNNSDDWSNFVTYFTGFLTPIISIIGFYLVLITIESSDKSNRTNNFARSIDNIEIQISNILSKKVYIQVNNSDAIQENIQSSLMITKNNNLKISDTIDMKHLNNQMQEIYNLRQLLIILSKLLNRTINIDQKNKEWTIIYKYKYGSICSYILDSDTFYLANLLNRLEEKNEKAFKLSEKDQALLNFYKVTALDIHKEEF